MSIITKCRPPTLKRSLKKYYHSNNLTIILSGKFDEQLIKKINQFFGAKGNGGEKALENITHVSEPAKELVHHVEKADSVQSAIVLGNISINKKHPGFLKAFRFKYCIRWLLRVAFNG